MLYGTLLLLGDSITFGARADTDAHACLGYPEHLAAILSDSTGEAWSPLNRGISGQTARQIADRAPGAFRELLAYAGPRWAVVLSGTNDAKHPGVPLDEWEVLFRQTVSWGRRAVVPLALCTFPPIRGAAMPAFGPNAQAWADAASARVRAIAAELDGSPSPVVLVELADMPDSLLCDGVHLSPVGYRARALRVADALRFLPPRPWAEIVTEASTWFDATDGSRVARPVHGGEACAVDPGGKKRGRKPKADATAEA
jgi:lysophospholipase L1-like esterase